MKHYVGYIGNSAHLERRRKHFVPQYVAGVKDNLQRLIMGKFARVVAGDVL
jgi:hypothetical protein